MEPNKEAISVRLARLSNQFLGRSSLLGSSVHVLKRSLNREGLLDALTVLYDECNNDSLKRNDEQISKFVDKYRCVLTELRRLRVNISDFEVKDIIGRGYFGEVHVVREKHTGDVYAMKTLRKDATLKQKDVTFYEEERDIMALASSNWITKLQYAFQDSAQLYLVMEFCPGGDLAGLLDRRGRPLPESDASFYLAELNQAINTLHLMGYVHRDIKPDNVLIDRCGHLKLADFGSAARISQTGKVTSAMPIGTPDYIAPELLKSMESVKPQSHGAPCDYWSLGIVAYEFATLCTPFVDADKPDSIAHTYNNIMQHGSKCQLVKFPADVEASLSQEYKDLVQCLLAVDEKKRFGYFETLKHQVFKDIPWNTIRDQVPPFVPIVSAVDDTSHFVEYEKQANQPSVTNFRTRSQFSGRNLPFIGFTYAHEPILPFYSHNNTHSSSGDAYADSESCSSHAQEGSTVPVTSENRGSNNGFLNSSFNNRTAINVGSVREMECLLESRKKEIESLQKKLASAETEAFLFADKERRLTEAENERGRLELEITELVVQNKKLTRQLELEHEDRKDLETKSLELINAAKKSWMSKTKVQVESLTANVTSHEARARELTLEKETLVETVKTLRGDLEKANVEIDCMKKLQSNYKDSMAKARKVSRQSIVGLEHMSAESNNQIQTLTQSLNRELETRRAIEAQLSGLQEQVKTCRDREKNLIVELEENKKDFSDLKKECEDSAKLRSTIENLEFELSSLRRKASRAERGENKMVQNLEETLAKEKLVIETQKKEIKDLQSALQQLEHALEQQRSAESTMEEQHGRTLARLQEKIGAAQQDRIDLQARLDATVKSEERHKDKVADLENLVMRLEQEVSKLERQNQTQPSQSDDKLSEGKVILLQEQLGKMEQQLSMAREELLVHKQEARKANTAQWKKEKELSELELDKKILTRELKQAEEQLKKVIKEKKSLSDRLAEKVKVLEEKASEQNELVAKLKKDAEDGGRAREDVEVTLREVNARLDEERKKVEKYVAEVERCKADIRKLKCELQYSENRRSKAESVEDDLREELKMAEALHHQQWEEAVKLRVTLDERVREAENFIANNKMLQDACTMLEEQLIDFEKLSEVQESKTQSMKCEVVTMRAEVERYKQKLSEVQQQASHTEKQVERAHEEKMAARALEDESRRTVNELENRIADLQNKITTLTEELEQKHLLLTEGELARASLTRRLSSQAGELAGLKEECAALRTNVHRLKEENMQVALRLQEAEENNATLKCMVEEKRSELDTQAAHHRQRELKADATLQQLTKLIDFLQTKIEESGRRKKMFAGMFGKSNGSTLKELGVAPGTPQTPSGNNLAELGRNLHKERSRNRELKEQLAMLKHKLDSLQGKHGSPTNIDEPDTVCDTPRSHYVSNALQRSINREGVSNSEMEGWIRIAKGSLLERVYLVLSEGRLSWYDDCPTAASSTQLGEVVVGGESTRVTSHIGGDTGLVQLSENDRKCAFVINTDNWQQKSLLFVCASSHQQTRWLRALEPLVSAAPAPRIHLRCYEPTLLLRGGQWLGVNCVVQLEEEIYVLGTDQGLHSHQPSQPTPLPLGGPPSVLSIRLAPHIGQALLVTGARRLAHCGLRELASRARRSAGVAGALACRDVCLDGERADVWQCMRFEISPARYGTDRVILCVAGTKKLILMLWDFSKCHFKQLRIMDLTSPVTCLLFTRHTILVGTNKLYEMDLTSYTTEEFLDASDISLTAAVYAYKKNLYPMSIIRIKEQKIDDMTEYLICYKEFGFFVDEFGHRTRTEDVKWTHTPLEFSFKKPFLFVLYDDKVDVLYVDNKAYQLPPCECNCETSSVSTFSSCTSADKVRIQLENPKLMGKSMNQGCIFIKTGSNESKQADVIEFNGNDAFRKDIGLSIETLDTAEDNDSCKNVKNVDSNECDVESVRSIDSSAECRTDFSANIRQRAKQIVMQHREKTDEHKITSILSKEVTKKFVPRSERENCTSEGSVSDSEFSVDSSDAENGNGAVYADTAAGRLRNGEQVRTTAEICTDMFLKKVRFDKK